MVFSKISALFLLTITLDQQLKFRNKYYRLLPENFEIKENGKSKTLGKIFSCLLLDIT